MWLFLAIIVAIVRLWEKETVASMWLRPFAWSSFAWGLLLAAVTIYIVMPALTYALRLAGIRAGDWPGTLGAVAFAIAFGAAAGWLLTHERRASTAVAVATFVLTLASSGPFPW